MNSPQHEQEKLEKAIHRVLGYYIERVLFPLVLCLGAFLIYLSRTIENFWPSLYLNIGSNLVVFVFLFWAFQYFTGKQPGDKQQESYERYRNVIDTPQTTIDYSDIVSEKPARPRKRPSNGVTQTKVATLPPPESGK